MSKEVILTGIRANNDLTIGNYFGAILPAVDMAKHRSDQYQVNLFVPDLHSFTTPIDHSTLQGAIWNNLRIFAAAGLPLDSPDIHIYRQSYVSAHSELTWILSNFTGFGEMNRMTQFKDKSGLLELDKELNNLTGSFFGLNSDILKLSKVPSNTGITLSEAETKKLLSRPENAEILFKILGAEQKKQQIDARVGVGLFSYPILMAADILLYGASYVPVGEDQTQHLEFTRDIAERMNSRFGELFTVPKPVKEQHEFFGKDQGLRIKDLQDPSRKMSKSDDTGKGVIFLGDSPEEAARKVMSATTDSLGSINLDWQNQPGISNLLTILALLQERPLEEVAAEWKGNDRYGDFKKAVADTLVAFLEGLQGRLNNVSDQDIASKLESSEAAMREAANQTLYRVQKAVGLRS